MTKLDLLTVQRQPSMTEKTLLLTKRRLHATVGTVQGFQTYGIEAIFASWQTE